MSYLIVHLESLRIHKFHSAKRYNPTRYQGVQYDTRREKSYDPTHFPTLPVFQDTQIRLSIQLKTLNKCGFNFDHLIVDLVLYDIYAFFQRG